MRRGGVWTVSGGKDYAGKPRRAVIVQDEPPTPSRFAPSDPTEAPLFRLVVEANEPNGLRSTCRLVVDKVNTVPKAKVASRMSGVSMTRIWCDSIRP